MKNQKWRQDGPTKDISQLIQEKTTLLVPLFSKMRCTSVALVMKECFGGWVVHPDLLPNTKTSGGALDPVSPLFLICIWVQRILEKNGGRWWIG